MPYVLKWSMPQPTGAEDKNAQRTGALRAIETELNSSTSSTDMYRRVIDLLMQQAQYLVLETASQDRANYGFLSDTIRSIVPLAELTKPPFEFALDPRGEGRFKLELAGEKLRALRHYFAQALADDRRDAIDSIYGGGRYKQNAGQWLFANDDLNKINVASAAYEVTLNAATPVAADKHLQQIDAWITATLQPSAAPVLDTVRNLGTAGAVALFCNDGAIPAVAKQLLLRNLADQMVAACTKSGMSIANAENRKRPATICGDLGVDPGTLGAGDLKFLQNIPAPDDPDYRKLMRAIVDVLFVPRFGKLQAGHFTNLLYKPAILPVARRHAASALDRDARLTDLRYAGARSFVQGEAVCSALGELVELVDSLLAMASVTVTWTDPDSKASTEVGKFAPYRFYDFTAYRQMLKNYESKGATDFTWNTTANSMNVPLLGIEQAQLPSDDKVSVRQIGRLAVYNSDDAFYLLEAAPASDLRFFKNGVTGKETMPLVKRDKSQSKAADLKAIFRNGYAAYWPLNWSFAYGRGYVPLYRITAQEAQSHVLWRITSGFGGGLARVDPVDSSEYYWLFEGDLDALRAGMAKYTNGQDADFNGFTTAILAEFLNLDYSRHHVFSDKRKEAVLRVQDIKPAKSPALDGAVQFLYWFLEKEEASGDAKADDKADDKTERVPYVLCHTPYLAFPGVGNKAIEDRLRIFVFRYFRRAGLGGGGLDALKVLKRTAANDAIKNRPRRVDVPDSAADDTSIGVNLPITLGIRPNFATYRGLKKRLGPVKNKGSVLAASRKPRESAAAVMSAIVAFAKPELLANLPAAAGSLSASALTTAVTSNDAQTKDVPDNVMRVGLPFWQALKGTAQTRLPTDQEWCHLMGHGDNGGERVGNFVSGSKHCNTEQLAIETAQRPITQPTLQFKLNASAYLLRDKSMKVAPDKNGATLCYLNETDKSYLALGYDDNLKSKKKTASEIAAKKSKDFLLAGANAPAVAFVRYKIKTAATSTTSSGASAGSGGAGLAPNTTVFDYSFEGQSEFIDRNQYTILTRTVQYLLDEAAFFRDLAGFYAERADAKMRD